MALYINRCNVSSVAYVLFAGLVEHALCLSTVEQVNILNDGGEFPSNAEVIVAPPSIFAQVVKDTVRSDVKVNKHETHTRVSLNDTYTIPAVP